MYLECSEICKKLENAYRVQSPKQIIELVDEYMYAIHTKLGHLFDHFEIQVPCYTLLQNLQVVRDSYGNRRIISNNDRLEIRTVIRSTQLYLGSDVMKAKYD